MELGQKIRQARLDAGLSQRQLCGDTITRNMLSQIENGSARPSMETLRILAQRLGKSVSYFLDEEATGNYKIMVLLRSATSEQVLKLLEDFESPDPVLDDLRYMAEAKALLELARQAWEAGKLPYAQALLDRAEEAGRKSAYYNSEDAILLAYAMDPTQAKALCQRLGDNTQMALLQAQGALQAGAAQLALSFLHTARQRTDKWYYLQAEALFALGQYEQAIAAYQQCQQPCDDRLEICYRELGDFQNAYFYACKQR